MIDDVRFRIVQMGKIISAAASMWPYVVIRVAYDGHNPHVCDVIRARIIGVVP